MTDKPSPNQVLGRWARCTLIGPLLPLWTLVTLAAWFGQVAELTDGKADSWATAMMLVSFVGAFVAVCLVAVDVMLLRLKFRRLPTGFLGWFSSMSAPFSVVVWLALLPEPSVVVMAVLTLLAAFWLGALSVRVTFGRKP